MKKCPFCAEDIQDEAIKCKHCGEFLDESKRPQPPALPVPAVERLPWYLRTSIIVLLFLTIPPLALPSVWMHPRIHLAWKVVITVAAIAICWMTYYACVALLESYRQTLEMLEGMEV